MSIDRDKIQQAAQKFVDKKKYDKAIIEYQKLIASDPTDARTLLKIGDLQSKMGAYPEAIATYEGVGKVYSQQGFALKAIAVYKQIRELVIKHAPQLEERYGHITPKLAELYKQLGLVSDALAALDEVATRLQAQDRDKEAIGVFEKIVELDPTNPLPHLRLAEALSRVRDVDGAVREFGIAAKQLIALGRKDDAIKVYERSLHHRPDEDQARACAELHVARGSREDGLKALAKLQVCFQANPRNLDTLALLARAFNVIGQAQKGIEVQKEMARIARDAGDLRMFREIIGKLLLLAPNDDAVKRLAGQAGVDVPGGIPPAASASDEHFAAARRQVQESNPPELETAPRVDQRQLQRTQELRTQELQAKEREASVPQRGGLTAPPVEAFSEPPAELELEDVEALDEVEEIDEDAFVEVGEEAELTDATERHAREEAAQESASARADELLRHAEELRANGELEEALETVGIARAHAPGRMDVLIAERDLLIETNRIEDAIETMLRIAAVFVEALDGDSAAQALQDVLAYDGQNRRALDMLHELGYEVVHEPEQGAAEHFHEDTQTGRGGSGAFEEPLPSYELAEGEGSSLAPPPAPPSVQEPVIRDFSPGSRGGTIPAGGLHDISDPFDAPAPEHHDDGLELDAPHALPSFPLEAPAAAAANTSTRSASVRAREMELGDALEEVEFFLSRGLTEDARVIIEQQLLRSPNNPLLLEKLQELSTSSAAPMSSGSGARERPPTDFGFNLEDSLSQLDSWMPGPAAEPQGQVDVEEIFEQFKEGVAKQISIDDSQAHYDLGLAYKEMGLLDDAIRELELAGRDHLRVGVVKAMIGGIELERGNSDAALEAFLAGLAADRLDPQQETMLCYEVGLVLEGRDQGDEALQYYERAHNSTPYYRDVEARIRKLRGQGSKVRPAVGDDFDREFDDIIRRG